MMRVIGYVRVSTDEQASSGVSLGAQSEKVRAYCSLYDLEIVELIEDAGASAKSLDRPGLARALALLDAGNADGIVVAKLDRLTRNVADMAHLVADYFGERAGKSLFSVADSIDTRTAAGRMVLNILVSVAQWEREAIGERTRDALKHKASRGERVGNVAYGYRLGTDGVHLEADEGEQAVIAKVRDLRAAGLSLRAIVGELARAGIVSRKGKPLTFRAVHALAGRA